MTIRRLNSPWQLIWVVTMAVTVSAFLAGCSATGETTYGSSARLTQANSLDITVVVDKEVSVLRAADDPTIAGAMLLGVAGDQAEAALRVANDEKEAEIFRSVVSSKDIQRSLCTRVESLLLASRRFGHVEMATPGRSAGPPSDLSLVVTITRWGLRPSLPRSPNRDSMQVGIEYTARITDGPGGQTLWDVTDIFLLGEHREYQAFRSSPALLSDDLARISENCAHRISNKVRLACQ